MRPSASLDGTDVSLLPGQPSTPVVMHHRLEAMTGGWFVGDFSPAAMRCHGAEVAVKHIAAGAREPSHEHRIATEVNVVVTGVVRIAGHEWRAGDVVVVPPHTPSAFEAVTDATVVVVKSPSLVGDKHPVVERPVVVAAGADGSGGGVLSLHAVLLSPTGGA